MPSLRKGNSLARFRTSLFLKWAPLALLLTNTFTNAQTTQNPPPNKAAKHRANEMTIAGLRPGRDSHARASQLFGEFYAKTELPDAQTVWLDACRHLALTIDVDAAKKIQVIRVAWSTTLVDCVNLPPSPWKTGYGLRVHDPVARVVALYGEPDSKSPSTRDGQPLELWYYAFDWAGPDVPQVMEVLCTREKDGQPGRVEEITLAAPTL
jgi:hypothetical protein